MGSYLLFVISFLVTRSHNSNKCWSETSPFTSSGLQHKVLLMSAHTHTPECQDFDDTRLHNVSWLHIKWKKSNCVHQEDRWGSQQDWISGGTRGRGGEDSDRRRGGRPRQQFKKLCMRSVPSRLTATLSPIPDIPEAAWLASGSERLILEQHVLHSSNHLSQPQARQSTTSTTRQSFVPVNLHPEKKALRNFIHIGERDTFFPPTSARAHPRFLGPATLDIPRNLMMLCNLSPRPIAQWD